MTEIITVIQLWTSRYPELALGLVFLVSLSESLAVVGLLVPGTVIMFGVGALVATGSLSLASVLLMAIAGAVIGDGASYWLGHYYQDRIRKMYPFRSHPRLLENGEKFFHSHGGKSVFFGRFIGPVRPVIPVVAGMLGMKPMSFTLVNILSAMGWAFAYIFPGVLFGSSLAVAGAVSSRLAIILSLLLAMSWLLYRFSRFFFGFLDTSTEQLITRVSGWTSRSANSPATGWRKILISQLRRHQGHEKQLLFSLISAISAAWLFLGILQDILGRDQLTVADHSLFEFLHGLRTSPGDHFFIFFTSLGDQLFGLILICSIAVLLLAWNKRRHFWIWSSTTLGVMVTSHLLKAAVHRTRPVEIYHSIASYSFPSSHAATTTAIFGLLAVILSRNCRPVLKWVVIPACSTYILFMCFSRLYLGVHWFSDVAGGFAYAVLWIAPAGFAVWKTPLDRNLVKQVGIVFIAVLVFLGGGRAFFSHEADIQKYSVHRPVTVLSSNLWQTSGWAKRAQYRIDLTGEFEQPFTIQWLGSADQITSSLMDSGWLPIGFPQIKDLLTILSPDTPPLTLPILPQLHDGHRELLRFILPEDNSRLVLRLWQDSTVVNGLPLFLGTVEEQVSSRRFGLVTLTQSSRRFDRSLKRFAASIKTQYSISWKQRSTSHTWENNKPEELQHWTGKTILLQPNLTTPPAAGYHKMIKEKQSNENTHR